MVLLAELGRNFIEATFKPGRDDAGKAADALWT